MPKFEFERIIIDLDDVDEGPREKSCSVADHKWELEIEDGTVSLIATDPCPEEKAAKMDWPVCRQQYWDREDIYMAKNVPVKVRHVDDSTPSTPSGPAEYGFYLEIEL